MCDIIMLIFGIITLVRGKFMLTRAKEVRGVPARIIGVVLMLPLPVSFLLGAALGVALATQGKNVDEVRGLAVGIGFCITVLCLVAAIVIAIVYARPVVKDVPDLDREDSYEGERPRRYKERLSREADDHGREGGEREDFTDRPIRPRKQPDDRIQE